MDNASISVDADSGRMMGESRFKPSFGEGDYVAFFCADFQGSAIRDNGIFVDSRGSADVKDVKISRGINGAPPPAGAFNRFTSKDPVLVRVGLSFISADQACSLAGEEIPSFDFQGTRDFAENTWKTKMGGISVSTSADSATSGTGMMGRNGTTTGNGTGTAMSQKEEEDMLKNFYSGIYRTMINPQNYTGVVPVVDAETIYFDSFYWFVPHILSPTTHSLTYEFCPTASGTSTALNSPSSPSSTPPPWKTCCRACSLCISSRVGCRIAI